ncbi:DUF3618 domain-containing protein [Actinocorallia longicatena]|uniref:DUF3618 domain-containing protein n=1 Tax=Actinocorallia longicatena TaxID=111803 RepID=A0ABP6PWT0_9ACTN
MTHSTSDPAFQPGDTPATASPPRPKTPRATKAGKADEGSSSDTRALREEIEQTRGELGDTVEALAAKADVKARAQQTAERLRVNAQAGFATATVRAAEYADRAGQAVRDPRNAGRLKGGGAAMGGAAVLGAAAWAVRRRRARRTRWEKSADAAQRAFGQAAGYTQAALRGDRAAQAADLSRRAAKRAAGNARKAAKKGQDLVPATESSGRKGVTLLAVVATAAGVVACKKLHSDGEQPVS